MEAGGSWHHACPISFSLVLVTIDTRLGHCAIISKISRLEIVLPDLIPTMLGLGRTVSIPHVGQGISIKVPDPGESILVGIPLLAHLIDHIIDITLGLMEALPILVNRC